MVRDEFTRWLWCLLAVLAALRLGDAVRSETCYFEWAANGPCERPEGDSAEAVAAQFAIGVVEGRIAQALDFMADKAERDAMGLTVFKLVDIFDAPKRMRFHPLRNSKVRVRVDTDMGPEAELELTLRLSRPCFTLARQNNAAIGS